MKICQVYENFIAPAKDSMGAQRVCENITKGLLSLGHEVVMKLHPDSKESVAPLVSEVPVDCDILHFHQWEPDKVDYNKYGKPWVVSLHGLNGNGDQMDPQWMKATQGNIHIVAGSQFVCNKINIESFVWSCSDSSDFIYSPNKGDYFLWMAGTDWGEGKGLWTTIKLAKKIGFKLKIAGAGSNQQNIDTIKSLCDSNIEYLGSINGIQKATVLSQAKALILLTRLNDACPTSVGEAMLSGTPVIGSTKGSMPEIVKHGQTGFVCEKEIDVVKAIMNVSHGKNMAERCKEEGEREFSSVAAAQKFLRYYKNMLDFGTVSGS